MRRHVISDRDAAALVRGEASASRPDLASLAESIAEFRAVAYASAPRPSAELLSRFELAGASEISSTRASVRRTAAHSSRAAAASQPTSLGGVRRALGWFAGLGVAAQILLGVSVAAAAGASGVGAVVGINTLIEVVAPQPSVDPQQGEPSVPGSDSNSDSNSDEAPAAPTEDAVSETPVDTTTQQPVDVATEQPAEDDEVVEDPPGNGNQGNGNQGNGNQGNGNQGNGNQGNGNQGNGNQGNGNQGNGNGNGNQSNGNGNQSNGNGNGNGNQGNGKDKD
jgi:hypothetical protein